MNKPRLSRDDARAAARRGYSAGARPALNPELVTLLRAMEAAQLPRIMRILALRILYRAGAGHAMATVRHWTPPKEDADV